MKMRRCAYCGETAKSTKDHVVPECLFKKPYPPNLITVPACEPCNNAKSLNDDFLRDMLVCDLFGSQSPVAQKVFESMLSSDRKDSSVIARLARANAQFKPLHTRAGIYLGDFPTFPIDEERVKTAFETIARGLYYDARRQFFPEGYAVEVRRYHPWEFDGVWQVFKRFHLNGPRVLGDVFGCAFASAEEDPFSTYWLMWFYERVLISVSILNPALVNAHQTIIQP